MINVNRIALWLLLVSLLAVLSCGQESDPAPAAAAPNEAGAQAAVLEFVEDLRLSPESGEDHLIWTGPNTEVEVDKNGHIFVVDSGGNRILHFDADGGFVKQIGQKGEGPGEFQALKRLSLLDDGTAIALEQIQSNSSLSYFDKDWKFVRKDNVTATQQVVGAQKLLRTAEFSPDGRYINAVYIQLDPNSTGPVMKVGLLDRDLNALKVLKELSFLGFDFDKVNDNEWWSDFFAPWFQAFREPGLIAFGHDSSIYVSQGGTFEVAKWRNAEEQAFTASHQRKPAFQSEDDIFALTEPFRSEILATFPPDLAERVTDDMFKQAIVKAEIPPRQMPIVALVPMDDGAFLTAHSYNPQTGDISADVFDSDGAFIGAVKLPKVWVNACSGFYGDPVKMVVRNGRAYMLEENDQGELSLVRYKIKRNR